MSLKLSRKPDESLVIRHDGEELRLTFRKVTDKRWRVDCDGPRTFVILRGEIVEDEPTELDDGKDAA